MDVVKSNFRLALDSFRKHVVSAKYCAIDLEMTGITIPGDRLDELDTPQQRYAKMRAVAAKYNIIQIGFCLVEESNPGAFILRPYNVFVFPQSRKGYDPVLQLSTSAIEFNRDHNMDWNKWVREGVSYLTREEEENLKAELLEESLADLNSFNPKDYGVTRASDIEFIESNLAKIMAWYEEAKTAFIDKQSSPADAPSSATVPLEYTLPDCNTYLRGALLSAAYCRMHGVTVQEYLAGKQREEQEALAAVNDQGTATTTSSSAAAAETDAETSDGDTTTIMATAMPSELRAALPYVVRVDIRGSGYNGRGVLMLLDAEEEQRFLAARQAQRETKEINMCGVRKMWQLLKDNRVSFVGHNCYYDLLFLFHYLEQPLPEKFEDFREMCAEFFPGIFCTKLIYSSPEAMQHPNYIASSRTHLGNLFEVHKAALESYGKPATVVAQPAPLTRTISTHTPPTSTPASPVTAAITTMAGTGAGVGGDGAMGVDAPVLSLVGEPATAVDGDAADSVVALRTDPVAVYDLVTDVDPDAHAHTPKVDDDAEGISCPAVTAAPTTAPAATMDADADVAAAGDVAVAPAEAVSMADVDETPTTEDTVVKAPPCTITTPEDFAAYENTAEEGKHRYHEAGYDAYCTAYLFTYLHAALGGAAEAMRGSVYSMFSYTGTSLVPGVDVKDFPRLANARGKALFVVQGVGSSRPLDAASKCGVASAEVKYVDGEQFLVAIVPDAVMEGEEDKGTKLERFLAATKKNKVTVHKWEDIVSRSDEEVAAAVAAAKELRESRKRARESAISERNACSGSENGIKKTRGATSNVLASASPTPDHSGTQATQTWAPSQGRTGLIVGLATLAGAVIGAFGNSVWKKFRT